MHWQQAPKITPRIRKNLNKYSDIEAQLLFSFGIKTQNDADDYFNSGLKDLSDPQLMPGIESAANRIVEAVTNKERIFIYGDYDVDGISATAILFDLLFRHLGAEVLPYIPNRFTEGYGMGSQGLDYILSKKGKLVITVDCGIRDKELVEEYSTKGLDFIITDHHTIDTNGNGEQIIPEEAIAVVHPGVQGTKYPFPGICGAAVAWKLASEVTKLAKDQEILSDNFSIDIYLDLVALATVCDVMPLQDENRILVRKGLKRLSKTKNLGLKELMKIAAVDSDKLEAYHLGFLLGPRINAGGRIEHGMDGVRMLTSRDPYTVKEVAAKLDQLNFKRKRVTKQLLEEAEAQVEFTEKTRLLFVYGDDWSEGVVGLVAGRLSDKYYRPAIAAAKSDGIVKGSARSIRGFNITAAIADSEKLLERYGGHDQAAGFSLLEENLTSFIQELEKYAKRELKEDQLIKTIQVAAIIKASEITTKLYETVARFKPFGQGNREPLFQIDNLTVSRANVVGKEGDHLKLTLESDNTTIPAIGFRMGSRLDILRGYATIDVVGSVSMNEWQGQTEIQLKLKDFREHER